MGLKDITGFDDQEYMKICVLRSTPDLQDKFVEKLRSLISMGTNTACHTALAITSHGLSLLGTAFTIRMAHIKLQKLRIIKNVLLWRGHPVPVARVKDFIVGILVGTTACAAGIAVTDGLADHIIGQVFTLINNTCGFDLNSINGGYAPSIPVSSIPFDPSHFATNAAVCGYAPSIPMSSLPFYPSHFSTSVAIPGYGPSMPLSTVPFHPSHVGTITGIGGYGPSIPVSPIPFDSFATSTNYMPPYEPSFPFTQGTQDHSYAIRLAHEGGGMLANAGVSSAGLKLFERRAYE